MKVLQKRIKEAPELSIIPSKDKGLSNQGVGMVLNPDFALVRHHYRVRLTNESCHLHTRVNKLVSHMYGTRGLVATDTSVASALPHQMTVAASSGDRVFGTLTLGVDAGDGLLADSLYRPQIDKLRTSGRRVCEVTRLAIDPELGSPEVMATIFNVAYLLAHKVHSQTDLFVEVHPRHAGFYRRTMGYNIAGPVRTCERVRAPAVLLHLCLGFAENQIRQLAGKSTEGGRSLYRLFLPPSEQEALMQQLTVPVPVAT